MKLGVVFPQGEIDPDPIAVKDFVQTVEGMGFDYLLAYELVIDTKSDQAPAGWQEPFTLLSYVAAVTQTLELATGVVVLPSRQTVLVAKQAAAVDRLSGGRLRLGFSTGWNQVEYQAMDMSFDDRGQRIEEQIRLMRALWTQPFVTFEGEYHSLTETGVYPHPIQRPIPIWLGGYADAVLRRIARLGDGWLAHGLSPETAPESLDKLRAYALEAGRRPEEVGLNIVGVELDQPQDWGQLVQRWEALGATHLDVVTREAGRQNVQEHIDALQDFKRAVGF